MKERGIMIKVNCTATDLNEPSKTDIGGGDSIGSPAERHTDTHGLHFKR